MQSLRWLENVIVLSQIRESSKKRDVCHGNRHPFCIFGGRSLKNYRYPFAFSSSALRIPPPAAPLTVLWDNPTKR